MLLMLLTLGVGQMWAAVTIYYVDKDNWGTVKCHHWKDGGSSTTWPGSSMSDAGHQKDGHTIYSITFNDNHDKCIFNNGSGTQTGNISISNGKVYYNGSWYTYNSSFWDPEFKEGQYIYINYSTSTWGSTSAKFRYNWNYNTGTYCCNDNESGRVSGENYAYAVTPNAFVRAVQILRFNSNYSTQWNYTNTVAVSAQSKNCITLTAGVSDNYNFSWTTYAPPLSAVSLSDNGTTILAGTGIESDPYLIATGSTIKVRASGTKAVPDPDATIYYNIKDNITSKQNSTTATYSFTASSTANTIHQMKVDGYTKVSTTSSSTLTSDIIYYKTVSVKDITVYIYVGGCTDGQINSLVLTANPYVGSKALPGVNIPAASFTTDGDWRKYTFTNVSEIQNLVVARSAGRAIDNITATDDIYYTYNGTELPGQCIQPANPTWGTAPASGAIGGSMTASVSGAPDGATITWTSTNTSAATVNSRGDISYVAAGNTTIKARVQKAAGGDYCELDYTLSQDISVTSGATVSATRTCPEYVSTAARQVSMHITFTGTSSGWKYRIKQVWDSGYSTNWEDASGSSADWTKEGGVGIGEYSFIVELYDRANGTLIASSSPVTVIGEISEFTNVVAGSNGSVSPSGQVWANTNHVHPTITATPDDHYHFVNWTSSNNTYTWVSDPSSASSTLYASASNYTITANFAGDQYSITYKDQGDVAYLGNNEGSLPATHTYGTATALVNGARNGYNFAGWYTDASCTVSAGSSIGATAKTSDFTLYAKWTEVMTTVTVNVSPASTGTLTVGGAAFTPGNTTTAGVSTSRTVVATAANDYTFDSWNVTGNATGTSSTNTYTLKGNGSGSTGTLTANFTALPCSLMYGSSTPLNSPTSVAMTYDATEHAYYKDITTNSSPFYFRFSHNDGKQYCDDWNTYPDVNEVTANGSKVACATETQVWYDKGSLKYVGNSGTSIRIWFDYQNKKAWITADKDNQYVLRGYKYDDSGAGGMPGWSETTTYFDGLASGNTGTITATLNAATKYKFKVYDRFSDTWYGYSTSGSEHELTDGVLSTTGTGTNNNFYFTTTISGTYTFTVDKSSGLKVKVDYPVSYQLNYDIGTVKGTSGSISTDPTTASGSYVPSGNSVELTAPDKKTGYTWKGWYTNAAGTDGKIADTDRAITVTMNADKTLYACYTINNHAIIHSDASHGSYTIKVGDASAISTNTTSDYGKTITLAATPATGYHFGSWSAYKTGTPATTVTVTSNQFTMPDYPVTVGATFTPNTYRVQFHRNGASEATVYQNFTYDVAQNLTANSYTRTGYTFGGWATSKARADAGTVDYTDGQNVNNLTSTNEGTYHLYAKWTPNPYTVVLDKQTSAEGYGGNAGTVEDQTVTFNATPATVSGTMPSAANGYAFMGFYSATGGNGRRFIDPSGNWVTSAGDTISGGKWVKPAGITLYAYYKKAEITELVASPGVIAPGETITITPTIEPTPTGTTKVCYELQYSNGTPLPSQPTFTPGVGNAVSFPVPSASATYIIQAVLETGSTCGSGTELSRRTTTFQVAGAHDVTVKYMCGDLNIKASEVLGEIRPLTWSEDITAPTITGYTFARWDAGDGVTIKDGSGEDKTTSTSLTIKIKAVYDGTLTAVYNKKNMIYFNNTLGWEDVWVYFYNSDKYWSDGYGTGAYKGQYFDNCCRPYWEMERGHMTQIEGTNIWYFDYTAAGYSTRLNVAFTNMGDQSGQGASADAQAPDNDHAYFSNTTDNPIQVVRRGDHESSLPMFVPLTGQTKVKKNNNKAEYMSDGYWMNYPENTGYSLLIYNQKAKAGATKLYEIPFEFTEDFTMPMELVVDLEAGQTYGFEIKRADGEYYGNNGTMTANTTNWAMEKDRSSYCGLQTTAAGNYTFRLYYSSSNYRMDVTYPVAVNDYRIVYTDLATWSKTAHTAGWNHPSRVITKNSSATEVKKDTVSFFWTYGSTPAIKYQTCTAVAAGSASWNAGTAIDVSGFSSVLTKVGVYNFIFEQPAGGASISLIKVEPYTGNFYIRTDCAGSTKWANFSSMDHQMTYSDYAEEHSGYSHYYAHWVIGGTNVKFCIANDYSMCITDTLVEDKGTVIANITAEGNDGAGRLNSGNASIRFMWDQATNKISRAYISGSTNVSDRFLVLEGDSKMYDKDGSALSISGLNPNEANLIDDQNFVYEREIQVNTKARAKLTAKYNTNIQYFKGSEGAFAEGTTIELLGGDADGKHTMRIVYDFKTNRLVTAYVPSGTIDEAIAINADLMIVREHQGAGQQLLFEGDGALSKVHTVYGVMRFNRWTLNNKEKTGGHSPVGDPKSIYERSLYWISFPFDVKLSDVFGFGTYGVDWIIEYYDGAERATNGYWVDSDGFWKMVMPAQRANFTLEAGKGYVLAIDVDAMKDNNTTFWANNIEQVELFFPSATNVENITQTTAHTTVPEHECTIDRRTDKSVNNINKDRTKADSHWNMIGIPSYANYNKELTNGSSTITWHNPETEDLPFLYEWNMTDDSYTVQSGTSYPFKAMHSYMVQYHGDLYWSLASATPTPSPIVARRAYAEKPQNAEFRLELQQNEKMVDQTFVNMKDAEEISAGFKFDEDLCKEFNAGKANIYTLIENYLPAAGNTLPMSEQTTLVPVGVKIAADGEYTFAIPEGTEGIGVVLIDNIAGTRTNLGLMDYSVTLEQGQIDNRFLLEISPIVQSPTGIELLNGENGENGVRKVLIDNILYIVKDGIVYDAQGHRVQ